MALADSNAGEDAIKNFAPFVSLGHESRTAAYRAFLEEHADAAAYTFPEISLAR